MKYLDPTRPRISNRPAYLYEGRAIAPLPQLMIEPLDEVGYTVTIMIVREDRGGSWHERVVPDFQSLQLLLSMWAENPEAVLFDFGWEYRDSKLAHQLEDLDDEPDDSAPALDLSDLD